MSVRATRRSTFALLVVWLAASLTWPGTPDERSTVTAAPHVVSPVGHPFDPDWPSVFWILRTKCTGCHRPGTERHDFTSYEGVVGNGVDGQSPVVLPGQPEDSVLFQQVLWNHDHSSESPFYAEPIMPPERAEWLTGGQLATLERWIRNGARQCRHPGQPDHRPLLATDFPSAKECSACHPRQYEQWSRSMHAYAQHSPVFEAFTLTMIERTGGTLGTFCTRCHTPIGVTIGETASTRNVHRARISMEGVTCVVCHRLRRPYYKSNARLPIEPGQVLQRCIFGPFENPVTVPGKTHPADGSDHLLNSAFCGSCHDVTNPQGVRLEEAFSEWQKSPAAHDGITCQQCHMGPIPGVPIPREQRPYGKAAQVPGVDPALLPTRPLSDHTFAGPDYSLLPDTEFPHKLDWMYETDYRDPESLTPHQRQTLTRLRIGNRRQLEIAQAKRYELLKNAAKISVRHPDTQTAGEWMKVHVDVTSTVAGHNFPTGFTAERQAWVEVLLTDPFGNTAFASGDLDHNGDLRDQHSHDIETGRMHYDKWLLNFQSKFVTLTTQGTERSVIIPVNRDLAPLNVVRPAVGISQAQGRPLSFRVAKSSLPPLQTTGRSYPIHLPETPGQYRLRVRLNFRHLPPALFDKIGLPHLKHLLEVVVIDEYTATILVH